MIFSKEFSYLGKPKWTTLNFREVFLRKKTKDRMWSMLFHLFLTTGLAAADCDIDACNIAISSSVGAARVCSTFGGLYYNRYWASFYTGCETATAVAQVGQLACGLCGDGDGISAEELRGLIGKVLEAENETQGLVGQVLNTQHETQSLIRRNAQEIMDGFKEVNQNIKKVGNQINSLRNDVSQLIKIKALQTSYLDDLHNFDLMAQKFEDLGSESFGLIVKSGKVDDFKTVVNDISEGAERTYANLHDMLIGGNWFHDSIFEIDSTSCSSKDYFLSLMTRLIEFEATAKAMDRKALDPVKIDRFKKMFIEIEQKHIETCGCPDGQAVRMRNLQRLVSHPTPRTSIAEFYNTISSSDLVDRLTQKKLNLLYKAKPFDFNLSILRAIKTLPIEVPEKISSLAEHNALSTLPLLENKLICTKGNLDDLLFITGGWNGTDRLSTTETYPRSSDCSPPSLPLGKYGHTTFLTSQPTALVATCGGWTENGFTDSCLVLDPIKERWEESRMGSLTMKRYYAAAVTLDHIGVYIIGGAHTNNARTSEFLAAGQMQWQEGPALPVDMNYPCSVKISPTSFLSIYGTDIREFDAAIAGPTSNDGWQEAGRWPALKTRRKSQPGCAKIGQKIIIAGGYNGGELSSTEVLDLVSRRITLGGEMATPRSYFHIATLVIGGEERMFALAGNGGNGSSRINSVEEWVEESSTWKESDNLVEKRNSFGDFGVVKASRHLVCPLLS